MYRLLAASWEPQALFSHQEVPWDEVLHQLRINNLSALAHVITQEISLTVPQDVQQILAYDYYTAFVTNTLCLQQLAILWETLSKTCPLILLKGPALTHPLHRGSTTRRIGDIDLLVPREHTPACRKKLLDLGYVPAKLEHQPGSQLQHRNEELFLPSIPHQNPVELHWHLLDVPYYLHNLSMDWFWENTKSLEIEEMSYRVLNLEANLVYLPAHMALHHRFRGLHSLLDMALLIVHNQDRIDWEVVIRAAQQSELLCSLSATLDRLAQYWPSLPIDEPRRLLKDTQPSTQDRRLFELLSTDERTVTLDFYTTLVTLPDFASRVRYAWVNLFPHPAYMIERYKIRAPWHLPYWYLIRFVGGLYRIARTFPGARRIDHRATSSDD